MADATTLCRRCGLCCDGNLFDSVPLTTEEAARGQGLLVVVRADGSAALQQRCAALGDEGCGVYAQRPGRCRAYRCMLLSALEADEVGLADASAIVDEAHARLAAVPAGPGSALARARRCGAEVAEARAAISFVGRHFERRAGSTWPHRDDPPDGRGGAHVGPSGREE